MEVSESRGWFEAISPALSQTYKGSTDPDPLIPDPTSKSVWTVPKQNFCRTSEENYSASSWYICAALPLSLNPPILNNYQWLRVFSQQSSVDSSCLCFPRISFSFFSSSISPAYDWSKHMEAAIPSCCRAQKVQVYSGITKIGVVPGGRAWWRIGDKRFHRAEGSSRRKVIIQKRAVGGRCRKVVAAVRWQNAAQA